MLKAKFTRLRERWLKGKAAWQLYYDKLASKYGPNFQRSWITAAELRKLDELHARQIKLQDRFFELLRSISPRDWDRGISVYWILSQLTYEDAVTSGELSVMPQRAIGYSEQETSQFARPVEQRR